MACKELSPVISDIIYLAVCAIEEKTPDPERVGRMDLTEAYRISERHLLTATVATALESAGIINNDVKQAKGKAVRKAAIFDIERAEILNELEKSGILYMPLKGCVIKDFYPKIGMRQMSDNDILYDKTKTEELKKIMINRGYRVGRDFGKGAHDQYLKEPVLNFEMHRTLFPASSGQKICDYYSDPEPLMIKDNENGFGRHFSPEDFYVYMTAHEYKHYSAGGTGLRSLLDTYLYLKKMTPDMDYIKKEVLKLGIADFEEKNRLLSLRLFGGEPLTDDDWKMLDYILSSGAYGTVVNRITNRVNELGGGSSGKVKYLFSRIFMPLDEVRTSYPFFYKRRIFLPALVIYRILKALTVRRRRIMSEIRVLMDGGSFK